MKITTLVISLILMHSTALADEGGHSGTQITGAFPWELVIDRGKIYGCIYENLFFSPGSIHLEEGLPRKCRIDSNRDGYWADMDERELELYEMALAQDFETMKVGDTTLSREEIAVISYMRKIAGK